VIYILRSGEEKFRIDALVHHAVQNRRGRAIVSQCEYRGGTGTKKGHSNATVLRVVNGVQLIEQVLQYRSGGGGGPTRGHDDAHPAWDEKID
jgi:hypothetical protein